MDAFGVLMGAAYCDMYLESGRKKQGERNSSGAPCSEISWTDPRGLFAEKRFTTNVGVASVDSSSQVFKY